MNPPSGNLVILRAAPRCRWRSWPRLAVGCRLLDATDRQHRLPLDHARQQGLLAVGRIGAEAVERGALLRERVSELLELAGLEAASGGVPRTCALSSLAPLRSARALASDEAVLTLASTRKAMAGITTTATSCDCTLQSRSRNGRARRGRRGRRPRDACGWTGSTGLEPLSTSSGSGRNARARSLKRRCY